MKLAKEVAKELEAESGKPGRVHVIPCELSRLESVRECAKEVLEKCPQIHVLINNAGQGCMQLIIINIFSTTSIHRLYCTQNEV